MTRHPPTTKIRIDLRTILSTGVLVVVALAYAGTAAGAMTEVVDGGYVGMQTVGVAA